MANTWNTLITDALVEINAFAPSENIPAADMQLAIRKLDRLLDEWAARKVFAYATNFAVYTLTPNHQPHLLGPALASPDFAVASRPVRIESAALILTTSTPSVDAPINVRDAAWWANQRVKALTSSVPTDLYYEPDFPNGALYLWPVPAYAYGLRLETWVEIAQIPLDSNKNPDPTQLFSAPPAYENALLLTLAEQMATPYGRPVPAELAGRAARARATAQSNNAKSPRIESTDFGTRGKRPGGFNYIDGQPA